MYPDPAGAIRDLSEMVNVLVAVLAICAAAVWWLTSKVIRGCPACAHCAQRVKDEQDRQKKKTRDQYETRFGREDVELASDDPSVEDGAPGSSVGDEGSPGSPKSGD